MSNLAINTNGNAALSVHKAISQHPAILSATKSIQIAANRCDMRAQYSEKGIGRAAALRGVFNEIQEIITRMGIKQANRPSPESVMLFAESVLEAYPLIIVSNPDKGIAGELISAYKAALGGNLEGVDLRLWGNGPNDQLFVSLATAYRIKQAPEESIARAKVNEYEEPLDYSKKYAEATEFRLKALAAALDVLPKERPDGEIYTREDLPPVLAFGFSYDLMATAGIIANEPDEKKAAMEQARGLVESEAKSKARENGKRLGETIATPVLKNLINAHCTQDSIVSTAKDVLFVAWLNKGGDFKHTAAFLIENKQAIIEKEVKRLLSKQNP